MTTEQVESGSLVIVSQMSSRARDMLEAHCRLSGMEVADFFEVDGQHIVLVETHPPNVVSGTKLYVSFESAAHVAERAFLESAVCFGWRFQDLVMAEVVAGMIGGHDPRLE